jgi:hypothetical protein
VVRLQATVEHMKLKTTSAGGFKKLFDGSA